MNEKRRAYRVPAAVAAALFAVPALAVACGGGDDGGSDGSSADAGGDGSTKLPDGASSDATFPGDGAGDDAPAGDASSGEAGSGGTDGAPGTGDAAPPPPAVICTPPAAAADTSHPTAVVGDGTAASCTASALASAVKSGGIVTFSCGASPLTIPLTAQIDLPDTLPIVIDGGNTVTLDGGGKTRIFSFNHDNSRTQNVTVTLQNLTLQNGHATGTPIPTPPTNEPNASTGTMTDGGGGAIFIRDGKLLVVNVLFLNNACAPTGPDVGGGAIYALQSLGVTVVGSRFVGNNGSNGGSIGGLFAAPLGVVNSTFTGSKATGFGGNGMAAYQEGSGGLGGAFYEDGTAPGDVVFCGDTVTGSSSTSLGGAWFRVNEANVGTTTVDRCTFDGNSSRGTETPSGSNGTGGGGGLYLEGTNVTVTASTISHNTTDGSGGGLRVEGQTLTLINSTLAANTSAGLGAGLFLDATATITNVTFAGNRVPTGGGYFSAAIASPAGSTATIDNTVFSANTTGDAYNPMTCASKVFGGTDDVQWPQKRATSPNPADTACTSGTTFADPLLGALANNGGPTLTYLPAAGSPAIGKGASCPATDQRGQPRKATGCTAGAVEVP